MKKILFLLLAICLLVISCDKTTDYKFHGSKSALFMVPNTKNYSYDEYKIAIDVYSRTGSDGDTYYGVKGENGEMYDAYQPGICPAGYSQEISEFRYRNLVGNLFFRP